MNQTACLSEDQLRALVLGEISEQDAGPLEEHLLECPQCVARTRALRSADTLVGALKEAGGQELSAGQSSAIDQLVHRFSDRSQLATRSSLLDATDAPVAKPGPGAKELIALLEPAVGPDELGRLGGFRVLKLLGHGGMGAVFLAEDVQLRRQVALKLLRPDQSRHTGAVERFMREARAAAAVRHDHVVTIYQVGEAHGVPFIAQELLEGENLEDCLKRDSRLPIADSLRIGREIAAGLAAAHARGLLHRDVKPSNIWLEGTANRVKILDFGLARSQEGDEQLTQSGMLVGTPAYMSPEQAKGQPLDARSDLFSLGGVLYRMVTGQLPFQGSDTLSLLRSLAVDEPPPARSLNPTVPIELSDLITRLLSKDANSRSQSATEVAQALATIESSRGTLLAGGKPAAGMPTRSRLSIALTAAAAVLLLGTIIITITRSDGTKTKIEVEGDGNIEIQHRAQSAAVTSNAGPASGVVIERAPGGTKSTSGLPAASVAGKRESPQPFYQNDFLAPDTDWLPPVNEQKEFAFRDGCFVIQHAGADEWWWYGNVPYIETADIEIVGRATKGSWGLLVKTTEFPAFGIIIVLNSKGEVNVRRFVQASPAASSAHGSPLTVRQKPLTSWKGNGAFNTLRALVQNGQISLWVNNEPVCDPISLPDPLPLMKIKFAGSSDKTIPGMNCEFDSIRVWRAGEGPPLSEAIVPAPKAAGAASEERPGKATPVYENDFSAWDPAWPILDEKSVTHAVRDGRYSIQARDRWWATSCPIPEMETADIELIGRATMGSWGLFIKDTQQQPPIRLRIAVDSQGRVTIHRVPVSPPMSFGVTPPLTGPPNKVPWNGVDQFNVLRVVVKNRQISIWLNGQPAYSAIDLDEPIRHMSIAPFGSAVRTGLDCEFDSIRVWRAGEGPPVLPLPPLPDVKPPPISQRSEPVPKAEPPGAHLSPPHFSSSQQPMLP